MGKRAKIFENLRRIASYLTKIFEYFGRFYRFLKPANQLSADPKPELRKHYLAIRKIAASTYREAPQAIATHLIQQAFFKKSMHIACYIAHRSEVATEACINAIWQAHKMCYLPKLTATGALCFAQYKQFDVLEPNRFGIFEPLSAAPTLKAAQLDLVLMPLVAFDHEGNRLGTGGGYYDRTFAGASHPLLIGLAYAAQRAGALPKDKWDIPLDGVITEQGVVHC